jgi:multidrug transporter EmrE-like cation transporter
MIECEPISPSWDGVRHTGKYAYLTIAAKLMLRVGIDVRGCSRPGGAIQAVYALAHSFCKPTCLLGFAAYMLATVVWFWVIATEPLSLVYSIRIGLTFALVTTAAIFLLHEALSVQKAGALATIVAGIMFIYFGKKKQLQGLPLCISRMFRPNSEHSRDPPSTPCFP